MDPATNNVTDDQELAKVLETMNQQATSSAPVIPTDDNLQQPTDGAAPQDDQSTVDSQAPTDTPELSSVSDAGVPAVPGVEIPPAPVEVPPTPDITPGDPTLDTTNATLAPVSTLDAPSASPELESIKKDALEELRPLVDKLNLPADEKFDTLLLIIRSTDDKSLVTAAHEAARAIEDETKRAQALLDVIKEIDYFSGHGQQPA